MFMAGIGRQNHTGLMMAVWVYTEMSLTLFSIKVDQDSNMFRQSQINIEEQFRKLLFTQHHNSMTIPVSCSV